MVRKYKKQKNAKKSLGKKAVNSVLTILFLIIAFGLLLNMCGQRAGDHTVARIRGGETINPSDNADWIPVRQLEFTDGIFAEVLYASTQFDNISEMPSASSGDRERQRRAREAIYDDRRSSWAALTTPLIFENFAGIVESIATSHVVGGQNGGSTKVTIEVMLFGSETVLEASMILDAQNDPVRTPNSGIWTLRDQNGSTLGWFDILEGSPVSVSGNFTRYTENTQWAHCCVSSTDFPIFRVDLRDITMLAE